MIYASDLDQTLIYSLRSGKISVIDDRMTPAEMKDEQIMSYISNRTLQSLEELSSKALFVPVTTRTIAQYKRIHIFQRQLQPKYAVTSNGGNILIHGVPDVVWNEAIHRRVEAESAPADDVKRLFERIATPEWVVGGSLCDGLFYSYRIHREHMPQKDVEELTHTLRDLGWSTSIQGRKIYFVPVGVNKRDAIIHLKQMLGLTTIIASGDSLLDQCLLDAADYAIAARHGELYKQQEMQPSGIYSFTEASGIYAADEIVDFVRDIMHRQERSQRGKISL